MNISHKNLAGKKQPGVTLLLALLVLGAVLAISFSLAAIIFTEVRSSADLVKTEGAIYGANGVGEQAFFNYGRGVTSPGYVTNFDNNVSLNGTPEVNATSSPTITDKIDPNIVFTNTTKKYEFCGSEATTSGCSYAKVILDYQISTGGDTMYAYLC